MLRGINCEVTPRRGHDTAGPQWGAGGPGASALSWGAGGDRSRSPRSCPSRREVSGCLRLLPLSGEGVGWLARTEDTEGVGDPPPLSPRQRPGSQGVRARVVQLLRFSGSRAHWATPSGGGGSESGLWAELAKGHRSKEKALGCPSLILGGIPARGSTPRQRQLICSPSARRAPRPGTGRCVC